MFAYLSRLATCGPAGQASLPNHDEDDARRTEPTPGDCSSSGEDEDEDEDEDEEDNGTGKTIKAFVAVSDQVHSVPLPLDGITSWANLSQTVHEVCEDSNIPDLPLHGIMHIVLNIDGLTVPVTGKTPLSQLYRAKALKVSIGVDDKSTTR